MGAFLLQDWDRIAVSELYFMYKVSGETTQLKCFTRVKRSHALLASFSIVVANRGQCKPNKCLSQTWSLPWRETAGIGVTTSIGCSLLLSSAGCFVRDLEGRWTDQFVGSGQCYAALHLSAGSPAAVPPQNELSVSMP